MASTRPPPTALSLRGRPSVRQLACKTCRDRKTFCNKQRPICLYCRERSEPCEYPETRLVRIGEEFVVPIIPRTTFLRPDDTSYYESLKADSRAYHALLARTNGNPSPNRPHAPPDEPDEALEDDGEIIGPFTDHHIERPADKPGTADAFASNVIRITGVPANQVPDQRQTIFDLTTLPSRRLWQGNMCLPPVHVGRSLFAAQYTYIGTIFAFTDPDTFEKELIAAQTAQPDFWDRDACLAYAKVLVILAFGKMYSVNGWVDYQGPPGIEYFSEALQHLPDAYEQGSFLCVETLALVGYFLQNLNQPDAAFLYIGMALRMAISLGLHQEVSPSAAATEPILDEAAREHRRRVWWSVYSLDRILSIKSGNPLTIHDEDIGVRLPSRLPEETEYCPAVVLRHYTQLSKILGDISKSIYRKSTKRRSARRLMAAVQSIILALSKWETELPNELRFHPDKLTTSRECVSTFSHYYQCINMTARPLLFHVVRKRLKAPETKELDWKKDLNDPTTVRVIEMCISAAKETIRMMAEAKDRNLLATYGYMDGEHVFSAAIVLVMVCAAFPSDNSITGAMNIALDLLKYMAERGSNGYMAARFELLARLRSSFVPGEHPQTRVPLFPTTTFTPNPTIWNPDQSSATVELVAAQAAIGPGYDTLPIASDATHIRSDGDALFETLDTFLPGAHSLPLANTLSPFTPSSQDIPDISPPPSARTSAMELDGIIWEESFADANVDAAYEFDHWNPTSI